VATFGGPGNDYGSDVAVDGEGNVVLTGTFTESVDFGGGPHSIGAAGRAVFVLCLSPDGAYRWDRVYRTEGLNSAGGIALDGEGNVVVTASPSISVDFGGGIHANMGNQDAAVWSLGPDGTYRWSRAFGGPRSDFAEDVAIDTDGSIVVVGHYGESVDFGGGMRGGASPGFVLRLSRDGIYDWDRTVEYLAASAVGLDARGRIYVAGVQAATTDFGGGTRTNSSFSDAFVWSLDSVGSYRWDRTVSTPDKSVSAWTLAIDPTGGVVVGGAYRASVNFGGGVRGAGVFSSAFLWSLDEVGAYQWDFTFGEMQEEVRAVAYGADGALVVGGQFLADPIDFGGGPRSNLGGRDGFVFQLEAAR